MKARRQNREVGNGGGGEEARSIYSLGDDLLHNILSRLPAVPFAFACASCRAFRRVCARILCRPKMVSAISSNPSFEDAVEETLDKLLSEPIHPHFALVNVNYLTSLEGTVNLMTKRLGKGIPIICCGTNGIICRDLETGELKKMIWNSFDEDDEDYARSSNLCRNESCGVLVTLGFVPGLTVKAIPLLRPKEVTEKRLKLAMDSFLADIRNFTSSVSSSASPLGILMFVDFRANTRLIIETMDDVFDERTIIAGFERSRFSFSGGDSNEILDVVSLVFAKDRLKPQGIGETYFSLALSTSLAPIGPSYKAASVKVFNELACPVTYLNARRDGSLEKIGGQTILNDIENVQVDNDKCTDMACCGVLKRRYSNKTRKRKLNTHFTFYTINSDDDVYLWVDGKGIRTADAFRIYAPSLEAVSDSRRIANESFRKWKISGTPSWNSAPHSSLPKDEVFGGLMFACIGRESPFFGDPDTDSSNFIRSFPNTTFAGTYCSGEIARGYSTDEQYPHPCHVHAYSTAYLLISYAAPPEILQKGC